LNPLSFKEQNYKPVITFIMPRRSRKSQSNDLDLVQYMKYEPKLCLPPQYNELKAVPVFEPIEFDPIINPGPNIPIDIDINDPLAFFSLFWT